MKNSHKAFHILALVAFMISLFALPSYAQRDERAADRQSNKTLDWCPASIKMGARSHHSGWTSSERSTSVADSRVEESRNEQYLICEYPNNVELRKKGPENKQCRTARSRTQRGFSCSQPTRVRDHRN